MNFDLIQVSPNKQSLMVLLLLASALVIIRSLLRRNSADASAINLDDLVLEWNPGLNKMQMSIIRVLALAAFAFTIWLMIFLTLTGKMTEGYLTIFNTAWVAPLIAQIIWGKKPPFPPSGPATTIQADNVTVKNP